jgi:hypothetical protein
VETIEISTNCCINLWYIHDLWYYSATKRNEEIIYIMPWINIENMMNERSPSQKTTCSMISFI